MTIRRYVLWRTLSLIIALILALVPAAAPALALPLAQSNPDQVALFGKVVSAGPESIIVTPYEPVESGAGLRVVRSGTLPGSGLTAGNLVVRPRTGAVLELSSGLADLPPGTSLLLGGTLIGGQLSAGVIADLRRGIIHTPTEAERASIIEQMHAATPLAATRQTGSASALATPFTVPPVPLGGTSLLATLVRELYMIKN